MHAVDKMSWIHVVYGQCYVVNGLNQEGSRPLRRPKLDNSHYCKTTAAAPLSRYIAWLLTFMSIIPYSTARSCSVATVTVSLIRTTALTIPWTNGKNQLVREALLADTIQPV